MCRYPNTYGVHENPIPAWDEEAAQDRARCIARAMGEEQEPDWHMAVLGFGSRSRHLLYPDRHGVVVRLGHLLFQNAELCACVRAALAICMRLHEGSRERQMLGSGQAHDLPCSESDRVG